MPHLQINRIDANLIKHRLSRFKDNDTVLFPLEVIPTTKEEEATYKIKWLTSSP